MKEIRKLEIFFSDDDDDDNDDDDDDNFHQSSDHLRLGVGDSAGGQHRVVRRHIQREHRGNSRIDMY